jgi:hypothetical protein
MMTRLLTALLFSMFGLGLAQAQITTINGSDTITSSRSTINSNFNYLKILRAVGTLTDGATIATDCSLANHFRVTLGGNRTLSAPTNPTDGQKVTWEFIQDATGSRTITLDSSFVFGTDVTGVTLSTTANKRDFMGAIYNSTTAKWYVVSFAKGY